MDKHLLTQIQIKDFKCFKDFEAKGLKRVNLIGGKNNVGKTAFMEACYVNMSSVNVDIFWTQLMQLSMRRNIFNYVNGVLDAEVFKELFEKMHGFQTTSNINTLLFELLNKDGQVKYSFEIDTNQINVNKNDFAFKQVHPDKIYFISTYGYMNETLKKVYIEVQKKDKEDILNQYIQEFDTNISNFKIMGGENPMCKVIAKDVYQELNEFGDGLKHYISIICSLYACSDSYLFIDEVDNGIHYSMLDKLWEIILTISKEQNVQVFATTHSKECIESYARVSQKLEDEEISFLSLYKNKNDELKSITLSYQDIQERIELGLDNR